jgi:hypothetical protein
MLVLYRYKLLSIYVGGGNQSAIYPIKKYPIKKTEPEYQREK